MWSKLKIRQTSIIAIKIITKLINFSCSGSSGQLESHEENDEFTNSQSDWEYPYMYMSGSVIGLLWNTPNEVCDINYIDE